MTMLEQYLRQLSEIVRLCEDTDGLIIVDKNGIIEYCRTPWSTLYRPNEILGRHIQALYPDLTEEDSTILQVLKTGEPIYGRRQELTRDNGARVILECPTLPVIVDGRVEGAVDSSRFYSFGQKIIRGGTRGRVSPLERMITQDEAMLALKQRIRGAAGLDAPVLIYGETGTGKELAAEAIHWEGARSHRPFVAQNCAAIPPNLLESIFFGSEKGSYTGATDRKGLFELADGGTLFLDEINSMDVFLQAKLLKALEEKKVRRVGGERDIPVDVRIVAALNEPPAGAIRAGRLREDLFYRLGVVRLTLPPLRERPGDIMLLTRGFIETFNRELHRSVKGVSPMVERIFLEYDWPGNVRELQNIIQGAFVTAQTDTLMIEDVQDILMGERPRLSQEPPRLPGDRLPPGRTLTQAVEDYERGLIRTAVAGAASLTEAARTLGVTRQTLKYKMEKFGL